MNVAIGDLKSNFRLQLQVMVLFYFVFWLILKGDKVVFPFTMTLRMGKSGSVDHFSWAVGAKNSYSTFNTTLSSGKRILEERISCLRKALYVTREKWIFFMPTKKMAPHFDLCKHYFIYIIQGLKKFLEG